MKGERYHRQILLPQVGDAGQARLDGSRVLLVGCGALGSVIGEQIVRAGVGFVRIVDRDVVELSNLQRQVLFDENDARQGIPKAIAAANRLAAINSAVRIEPHVADVNGQNIESLMRVENGFVDLILDGTDNVETRYLINDACVKDGVPWVYGACVGTEGRVLSVIPGKTACLRCVFPQPPSPGELPTCDTAGVLAPTAAMVASAQVVAAMKILMLESAGQLVWIDGWDATMRSSDATDARRSDCPTCGRRRFEFLESSARGTVQLCGRDTVQVRPAAATTIDLKRLAAKLSNLARDPGKVQSTPYLVRFVPPGESSNGKVVELTIFADGRALVRGVTDGARARSLYARYVGS